MAKSVKVFFSRPKTGKSVGREAFCGLIQYKKEKNQLGGNKHYGKKVLLSLQ